MQQQNLDRLAAYFRTEGISTALLSSPWTTTWLTGYAAAVQTGPSPFEAGPILGWWRDRDLTFVCSDADAAGLRAAGADVVEYPGYTYEIPLAVGERQATALGTLLRASRGRVPVVHAELRFLPAAAYIVLQGALPDASLQALDGRLESLRAVKTPEEIGKLRTVLALCDQAETEVRELIRPGISEIELWGQLKARLEIAAGGRLPVQGDLVAGPRTVEGGGWAGRYVLDEGDPVLADVVPRLGGYWGDICGTHFAGAPSSQLRRMYSVIREVQWRAMDAVSPGLRASELDALMRAAVTGAGLPDYQHHSGHGIGVCAHEEPRIVPYNETPLEPGMVIALEPATYVPGVGGVRLENVVLVTASGCELLTQHLMNQA